MVNTWLESGESSKRDICDKSKVSHLLSAAKSSQWSSPVALWCFCIYTTREGRCEQAAHRTGQSNTNQFIPFLRNNMQSFNVRYSQCINSCVVSVYPLTVCHVFVVYSCVHCVRVCVCVCVLYTNVWELWCEWVLSSSLSVIKLKVNKGALTYLIYLEMEKCNWIRGKSHWWSHQCTSFSIGQNDKVTTYVLQGFSLLLDNKRFKELCVCVVHRVFVWNNWWEQNDNLIFFLMQNLFLHSEFIHF